ncbi:MAG: thiamine phosphate synthase [Candidatus Helarchaeota archaeon]
MSILLLNIAEIIKLYLVTDRRFAVDRNFNDIIIEAIAGGVTVVQLREKNIETREFYNKAIELKAILKEYNIPLIINDRVDIAYASDADGVHLGQSDLPIKYAREILGKNKIIGLSVNTVKQAIEAEKSGADYIAISPVFPTPTKVDIDPPVGLEGIPIIRESVNIPIVGIGGINKNNAKKVIEAGCDGVAVVSAIMGAKDPKLAASELLNEVLDGLKSK